MNASEVALNWAKGLEEHQDGVAQHVDAKEVKAHIDIDDVDKNDISDVEDTETKNIKDGGDDVKVAAGDKDISVEDFDTTTSSANGGGKEIDALAIDEATGLPRRYVISGFNAANNSALEEGDNATQLAIVLQNGTIPEAGLNGVTAEDLLKVCREIFTCYQESKFACEENAEALEHINGALAAQAKRMERRAKEGTEGTHEGN
ncbi:hypothetical protein PHABIO_271 [Pseudomonas phage Phabio]|uniref:Acb2/Tad1 hairpin domain-containing protein n=1 Tax=Pseudomonas phage Phabio TaxID=2006668 RepID=A0A1Y0STU0_9CAUD|nr:hypothetical protein MZD05_gp271 [Pseudomonas phage Phabio]ARV76902.1 hypothetical protein PHABIO_271 [Pseudomonas phage Phabio]